MIAAATLLSLKFPLLRGRRRRIATLMREYHYAPTPFLRRQRRHVCISRWLHDSRAETSEVSISIAQQSAAPAAILFSRHRERTEMSAPVKNNILGLVDAIIFRHFHMRVRRATLATYLSPPYGFVSHCAIDIENSPRQSRHATGGYRPIYNIRRVYFSFSSRQCQSRLCRAWRNTSRRTRMTAGGADMIAHAQVPAESLTWSFHDRPAAVCHRRRGWRHALTARPILP